MLTASNLIVLYDETTTPTLYHRSTGTTSIPGINIVSADIVNKSQVHCSKKNIGSDHRLTLIQLTYRTMQPQNTRTCMEKELKGGKLG